MVHFKAVLLFFGWSILVAGLVFTQYLFAPRLLYSSMLLTYQAANIHRIQSIVMVMPNVRICLLEQNKHSRKRVQVTFLVLINV